MMKLVLLTSLALVSQITHAITIDEYLALVKQKNRIYTSVDLSVEASNARREAGDLVLTPTLTAGYTLTNDKALPSTAGDERKTSEYNLGLSKRFSTGTSITLSAKTDHYENKNPLVGGSPDYSTGGLGIGFSQSLWRDAFGNATRLRYRREEAVNTFETLSLDLRRRNILIEAESSFWDYAVATEDLKLKQENFDRAKKLDRWTSGRVNNGISDRSDLMNVKALMSIREFQLQTAQDDLKTQEIRFRENLDLAATDPTPAIRGSLVEERPYVKELVARKNMILIDSYLASLDAKARQLTADELRDSLRPDLALIAGYTTSAYDPVGNNAQNDLTKTDRPRTYVGLSFTWQFDTSAKRAQIDAYKKDAEAARYTAEKRLVEGRTAWTELLRKYQAQQEAVKTLEKIANYQKERVKAEQDKFSKGRTITTNVVTAETDSAEADVTYLRARSGLRKLEASTLLYTSVQE